MAHIYEYHFECDLNGEPDLDRLYCAINAIETNPNFAMAEFKDLADAGSTQSMVYLGYLYGSGIGVEKSPKSGEMWYKKAELSGSIEARYRLSNVFIYQGRFKEALDLLKILENVGYTPGLYSLGAMYMRGQGVDKDMNLARKYWSFASERGHLIARRDLASVYLTGKFGFLNLIKGIWWKMTIFIPIFMTLRQNSYSARLRYN